MSDKMNRPELPPLRDLNYEMRRMAEAAVDLMYGDPFLTFAANKTVQEVLGLEADETEMYEYKGEGYTFDQLVEYIAPKELHRLDLQERLHYVFTSHGKQIPYTVAPPVEGLRPTLQTQPWLFPDMMYRFVEANGDAHYCSHSPQFLDVVNKWVFSGLTFHIKAHKLEHKYASWGCANSLQQLCSTDLTKIRNIHDGTFVENIRAQ